MANTNSERIAKKLETGANLAIILVAVAVLAVFAKNHFTGSKQLHHNITAGARVDVNNVNWHENERNLVLVVSTTCHFCTESAGFYQKLVQQCERQHVRSIAVLPQPVADGEAYLKKQGISVNEIRQADLSTLQVNGTPTLLLVDGKGVVKNVWIGKLPDDKEKEVLAKITS
jgi:thioredoxin-related protein